MNGTRTSVVYKSGERGLSFGDVLLVWFFYFEPGGARLCVGDINLCTASCQRNNEGAFMDEYKLATPHYDIRSVASFSYLLRFDFLHFSQAEEERGTSFFSGVS